MITKAHKRARS